MNPADMETYVAPYVQVRNAIHLLYATSPRSRDDAGRAPSLRHQPPFRQAGQPHSPGAPRLRLQPLRPPGAGPSQVLGGPMSVHRGLPGESGRKGQAGDPGRLPQAAAEGSFVSLGPDAVLAIYPPDLWALWPRAAEPAAGTRPAGAGADPVFAVGAFRAGRPGTDHPPPEQRRLAEIGCPSSVVVIGSGSRVEIWPEARWDNYSADAQGRFTESADRVIGEL